MSSQNQISAEERKKNREKYMIKDKENETIYRHYGDLNGADFKLRNNKNCEIYILDWSKGMYIDDCFDCKIFCGPIDGSIFIRGSKNCQISLIARQVRFRSCENIKVFTYCPSDPAVESSFNIYFAPFNAFFPHLKELFVKGEFKSDEKNHIDTPYDFTPSEELGGGAPHYLQLPEEEFFIKVIKDGDSPVEEMFDGYSEKEPWIQNKANELPSFEKKDNINSNDDDFNFISENDNKPSQPNVQPTLNDIIKPSNNKIEEKVNDNYNNIMNMDDFLSDNIDLSNQNKPNTNIDSNTNNNNSKNNDFNFDNNNDFNLDNNNKNNNNDNDFNFDNNNNTNNNNNNDFMDMNDFFGGNNNNNKNSSSQPKSNIDFNNFNMGNTQNNNNNFNTSNNLNNFFDNNMNNMNSFNNAKSKEENEELRRQELRNKEKEMRQQKIREKMEKEAKMRMDIMAKASEYMKQFYEERKKKIALNHEKLLKGTGNQNNNGSGSPWGMAESSFTGSTSNADRMKEVILNRNKDQHK